MLGWWRDWRERRSVMAEMDRLRRDEEAVLLTQADNPLHLAKLSLTSDPVQAAAHLDRARHVMPRAVLESKETLDILLALERYDEADALMRERQKRIRGDLFSLTGLARIAERRGDTEEALKRWKVVRSRLRDSVDGYDGCARCLMHLGRYDEAETCLNIALRRDPSSLDAKVGLARISDRRPDWETSVVRWKEIAETWRNPPAYAFAAKALAELGRIDEAEALLAESAKVFRGDREIAETRAELAQRRGDLAAACDHWATARAVAPYAHAGYLEGANRLAETGRLDEAEAVLREAIERFPNERWPWLTHARIAHDRRDWNEAAVRWAALRQRFPDEDAGYSLGAEALKQAGREVEAATLSRAE